MAANPDLQPTDQNTSVMLHPFYNPLLLPPGELLSSPHPADEDEPNLLLVPGLPVLTALCPPGRAVPAKHWRPPVCHCDQRLCCGHGREKQLLRSVSHQLVDDIHQNTGRSGHTSKSADTIMFVIFVKKYQVLAAPRRLQTNP